MRTEHQGDATDVLSEDERARIRAETRYALAVVQEMRPEPPNRPKSFLERTLPVLGNGSCCC